MAWRGMHTVGCSVVPLACAAMMCVASDVAATAAVRTIALSGQNPFSSGEAAGLAAFSAPSLNNRGYVAFSATLSGDDVSTSNDTGLWVANHGSFETVAREGSAATGLPAGSLFGSFQFSIVPLNDSGQIAFTVYAVIPDSVSKYGIWASDGDSLQLLAGVGGEAPGAIDDATFRSLSRRPTINRHGVVAFAASLSGNLYESNNAQSADGIWISDSDQPAAVAISGEHAVGISDEATFTSFLLSSYLSLNRRGNVAFWGQHVPNGGPTQSGTGIWLGSPAGLGLLARSGQPMPELGPSATAQFGDGSINAHDTVGMHGNFFNADGPVPNGDLIGLADDDGLTIVARSGVSAPGAGEGHTFISLAYEPSIGSGGHIAFYARERNEEGTILRDGVWAGTPDALQLVAHEDDPAPGTEGTFGGFYRDTPAINRFGQIAFKNVLTNVSNNGSSLWATDLDGNLTLIARNGQFLEVADGDGRTIASLNMLTFHGDDDGRPRSLNDLGQIVFQAGFTDGTSGVFLSNAVAHLPGDYNGSGVVDAADYPVWRNSVTTQNLAADGDRNGVVDGADYDLWKEFYGVSLDVAGGGGSLASVPEPDIAVLGVALFAAFACRHRRSRRAEAGHLPAQPRVFSDSV